MTLTQLYSLPNSNQNSISGDCSDGSVESLIADSSDVANLRL